MRPRAARTDPTDCTGFQVDQPIKGDVEQIVEVHAAATEGDSAVVLQLGTQVGVVPATAGGRNTVVTCADVAAPADMYALLEGTLPAPTGEGPVAALVATRAGPAQFIAVDAAFRPLGYVEGAGSPSRLGLPGARPPSAHPRRRPTVLERVDLVTLQATAIAPLDRPADAGARLFCASNAGAAALFVPGTLHVVGTRPGSRNV